MTGQKESIGDPRERAEKLLKQYSVCYVVQWLQQFAKLSREKALDIVDEIVEREDRSITAPSIRRGENE